MTDLPPLTEATLETAPAPPSARRKAPPVPAKNTIRQTSRRVSPSRATGRSVERHDQRRQPKRGRRGD